MKFTMTVSEECFNTILTALRFEEARAEEEDNEKNLAYIEEAIREIEDNTYVASIRNTN